MEYKPKVIYEWVLKISSGDEIVLTEKQYEFYKENFEESKIFLKEVEINPAFVMMAIKRPAQYLRSKYACKPCLSTGKKLGDTGWCEVCEGSGVNFPKQ